MEWLSQLRWALDRSTSGLVFSFCDHTSVDRHLVVNFWVRKGNTLDAPLTLVEDVLEDSHSEIQKETSLLGEDENMSDDRKEKEKEEEIAEKEKKVTISEEREDITNEALSNEFLRQEEKEKEDVAKVFNSTKKDQASVNAKKMRRSCAVHSSV